MTTSKDPINNPVILRDNTSPVSPSIAFCNGNLYLAWKGDGNDDLNVMVSTDAGASFGHKFYTPADTSSDAPALASDGSTLFIAWKDGNDNLNVAGVFLDLLSGRPLAINPPAVLGDTSPRNPALAGLNGNVYLAWKGDGNDNLNVKVSTNAGASFGQTFTSAQTSSDAPALASDGTTLFVAWKGDGNDELNVARVTTISVLIYTSEFTVIGSGWAPGTTVQVTSNYDNGTSNFPGSGGPYPVAADGTFSGTIPAIPNSYFNTEGTLFVEATDAHSGQYVSESVPHLGG